MTKKIAIFHNFLDNIGGAEYVDLVMARELGADIYTTCIDSEKIKKMGFADLLPKIFSIGKVPVNAPFRQEFSYWKFRRLNLSGKYDFFIIAGDWAMSAAVKNKPHLWYVYSPTREIWDLKDYTKNNLVSWWKKPIFEVWVLLRRMINKNDSKKVEKIVSISKTVQQRVKKYLDRDSEIIYPPTDTKKFCYKKNGDFWLSVNRLIAHKRIDLQLRAFAKMPKEKLIIVGCYEKSGHFEKYAKLCQNIKPKNVEIKSWISEAELVDLYANCKGFITTSKEEDFGMNVVEAMASGKPIIAPKEGGYKETVVDKKTGILIDNIDEDKIIEAIKIIGKNPGQYKNACFEQARKFDVFVFIKKIKSLL